MINCARNRTGDPIGDSELIELKYFTQPLRPQLLLPSIIFFYSEIIFKEVTVAVWR